MKNIKKNLLNYLLLIKNISIKIILFIIIQLVVYEIFYVFSVYIIEQIYKDNDQDDDNDYNTFSLTIRIIYYFSTILITLLFLGLNKKFIVTYFSGFSLVLGYALQDFLSNLFNGLILAYTRPISIKDYIELDERRKGFVYNIDLFRTTIVDGDNNLISVTNNELMKESYKKIEYNEFIYETITFGVPYLYPYKELKEKIGKLITSLKNDGIILRNNEDIILEIDNFSKVDNIDYEDINEEYAWFALTNFNFNNGIVLTDKDRLKNYKIINQNYDIIEVVLNDFNKEENILYFEIMRFNNEKNWDEFILETESIIIKPEITSYVNSIYNRDAGNLYISKFDDSAVIVNIYVKCEFIKKRYVFKKIMEEVNNLVINKDIEIPFPQLDLHVIDPVKIDKKNENNK